MISLTRSLLLVLIGAVLFLVLAAGPSRSSEIRASFGTGLSGSEIEGAGRVVYPLGLTKTCPMEGFGVTGNSKGGPTWMRASPRPDQRGTGPCPL